MAKERLAPETSGNGGPQLIEVPPVPAPQTPARELFDRFQKLLRFDPLKKWQYFPLERIEFCRPPIIIE